jgi:hypothetical protein
VAPPGPQVRRLGKSTGWAVETSSVTRGDSRIRQMAKTAWILIAVWRTAGWGLLWATEPRLVQDEVNCNNKWYKIAVWTLLQLINNLMSLSIFGLCFINLFSCIQKQI